MEVPIKDHPHLTKIGPNFYFRRKVPLHLVDAMGSKKEIKISLKTQDRKHANKLIAGVAADVQRQFDAAEKTGKLPSTSERVTRSLESITLEELENSARDWFSAQLQRLPRALEIAGTNAERAEAIREAEMNLSDISQRPNSSLGFFTGKILESLGAHVQWKEASSKIGNIELAVTRNPRPIWGEEDVKPRMLIDLLYRAELELARYKIARLRGDFSDKSHDSFFDRSHLSMQPPAQFVTKNSPKTSERDDERPLLFLLEEWKAFLTQELEGRQVTQYVSDLKALGVEISKIADFKTSALQNIAKTNCKDFAQIR